MLHRKRFLVLILVLILAALSVLTAAVAILYNTSLNTQKDRLVEMVRSHARLIEAVSRFNEEHREKFHPDETGALESTLKEISNAHKNYAGPGETGEFVLGTLKDGHITFLAIHGRDDAPRPVPFEAAMDLPMGRALTGKSGSMVGIDSRGEKVLAAYEPVAGLNFGIVSKIDLSEIRSPFIKFGMVAGGLTVFVIILGSFVWIRLSFPLLKNLENQARHLGEMLDSAKKMEAQLIEKESKYRELFENMTSGAVVYEAVDQGKDFIIQGFNRAAERIEKIDRADVIGKRVTEVFPGVRELGLMKVLREVWGTGVSAALPLAEYRNGRELVSWRENLIYRLPMGEIVAVYDDITDRERVRQEIIRSRAQLEAIFNSITDAIIFTDPRREVLKVNPAVEKMFGYPPEELIGSPPKVIYADPADYERMENNLCRPGAITNNGIFELPYRRKDGTVFMAESLETRVQDEKGNILGFVSIHRDITRRKEIEEYLHQTKKEWEDTFNAISDWVSIVDIDGRILMSNRSGKEFLDKGVHEIIGRKCHALLHHADSPIEACPITRMQKSHKRESAEILMPDGRWVLVTVDPLMDDKGTLKGGIHIVRDISEQKNLESLLQQTQKIEAIGTLAGGIAHDFNNILSSILGYAELSMVAAEKDSRIFKYANEILKATGRASDLIRQILTFSRQSRQELHPIRVKLLVKEALKLLRASLPATIEILQYLEGDEKVLADSTQVHQIVMNLCTNAAQAMEEKGGILEINLTKCEKNEGEGELPSDLGPGPYLKLSVGDTGPGMGPEILKKVFEPFFTTRETGRGTGLGLSVVHGIVKSIGGEITVRSELGTGTVFNVYLPIFTEKIREIPEPADVSETGSETVLFVDDEPMLIQVYREQLEKLGYHVDAVDSGLKALELFTSDPNKYDLVITDMTMPKMTGDKLAGELLKIRPGVPVILCTGYSQQITEEKAHELGIRSFIMKPLKMKILSETIRRVLDNSGSKGA